MSDKTATVKLIRDGSAAASEALVATVIEAIPDAAALFSADGLLRHANTAFRRRLAWQPESDAASPPQSRWLANPGQDLARFTELLRRACETKLPPRPIGVSLRASDGSHVLAEVHARCLQRGPGELPAVIVVFRDITRRQALASQVNQHEKQYNEWLDTSTDMVFGMDTHGQLLFVNKAWQERLGFRDEEVIGTNVLDLICRKFHKETTAAVARLAEGRNIENFQFRSQTKDGRTIDVLTNLRPIRDASGKVVQILGAGRDITELKRTQKELRESQERFQAIFEYAPDGYYLCDLKGTFVDGNRAAERIMGCKRKELIQKNFLRLNILSKNQIPRAAAALARNVLGKPTGPDEFVLNRNDGTTVPVEISTYPVRIQGKVLVLGIARDISKRKEAERNLEAVNRDLQNAVTELERSNRELRDFAHVTAHDLKAPLRGITMLADWIAEDCADTLGEPQQENLRLLQNRADRMTRLIEGILRYSEIGHNDNPVDRVDVHALVREVVEQIAPPDHVEIRIENTLPVVACERTRLIQVFQNLISNSVRYIDKPVGKIRIGVTDREAEWIFHVADNGPGIKPQYFEQIFKMFCTLSSSEGVESTGLGLAVVKKIVELHGGRVWVESEVGRKSTFYFTLPKQPRYDARR